MNDYKTLYHNWIAHPMLCAEGLNELQAIAEDEKEIEYRFGAELAFGTAGMRGIIGYGTNMMNIYTVRRATKGLADYIIGLGSKAMARGVAISYDTRRYSHTFALAAAGVLAANGIKVYLYGEPRPVPMLSYAVRKLKAIAGIMITASHNPKEYNGYKVYGEDGAQMSPEATAVVVENIKKIKDYFSVESIDVNAPIRKGSIVEIGKRFEKKYYNIVRKLGLSPKAVKEKGKSIKIVYTSLHGTGLIPVTTVLGKMGIDVAVVEEQKNYDGEYPTVEVPNPENKEALKMAIELANKIKADVVFGTDPDCDRLGVAIRNNEGEFEGLTGNQVGALMLEYVLMRLKQDNKMPANAVAIKSFVSTNLAKSICASYGVELCETPVGFKFIGEKIKNYEQDNSKTFVFGFEESCGYLRGTHARDKDAVVASMLFAELACWCAYKGKSVYSLLNDIYERLGYVYDNTINIKYSGLSAMADMNAVVEKVRKLKPTSINNYSVVAIRDYLTGERFVGEEVEKLEYSNINCIYFELENGSFVCLRPSGTEPKLKIYYSISAKNKETCIKNYQEIESSFSEIIKS
ncbi:MAG: phospho-sugar mutase [Clostridiales bacterium]|nr:phospho-sugar mutase [Clostridiales bacterium]